VLYRTEPNQWRSVNDGATGAICVEVIGIGDGAGIGLLTMGFVFALAGTLICASAVPTKIKAIAILRIENNLISALAYLRVKQVLFTVEQICKVPAEFV